MKYDLSIIVPGFNKENWINLYNSIYQTCAQNSWEMILVAPFFPPGELENIPNFKFVRDFGCPSRAFQIGLNMCEGEFITYVSDDCYPAGPNRIDNAISLLRENDINNTAICLKYYEAPNSEFGEFSDDYWRSGHHDDIRIDGDENWNIFTIPLMSYNLMTTLGGIDVRYEHLNLNLHLLAYKFYLNGGRTILSKDLVWRTNFSYRGWDHPVLAAYKDNDKPLWDREVKKGIAPSYGFLDNWKMVPTLWPRRWKVV